MDLIRHKWNIFEGISAEEKIMELLDDKDFDIDITKILKEHKLEESWRDWLYIYIIYRNSNKSFNPFGLILVSDNGEYSIKILPTTKIQDVEKAFKFIRSIQKDVGSRMGKIRNLKRDTEIMRLYQDRKTITQIDTILQEKGYDLDYGQIKTVVSRMNKKIGVENPKTLKTEPDDQKLHLS